MGSPACVSTAVIIFLKAIFCLRLEQLSFAGLHIHEILTHLFHLPGT
jgi:hypothetical protein